MGIRPQTKFWPGFQQWKQTEGPGYWPGPQNCKNLAETAMSTNIASKSLSLPYPDIKMGHSDHSGKGVVLHDTRDERA